MNLETVPVTLHRSFLLFMDHGSRCRCWKGDQPILDTSWVWPSSTWWCDYQDTVWDYDCNKIGRILMCHTLHPVEYLWFLLASCLSCWQDETVHVWRVLSSWDYSSLSQESGAGHYGDCTSVFLDSSRGILPFRVSLSIYLWNSFSMMIGMNCCIVWSVLLSSSQRSNPTRDRQSRAAGEIESICRDDACLSWNIENLQCNIQFMELIFQGETEQC